MPGWGRVVGANRRIRASLWATDPRDALRVTPDFDLTSFDRDGAPGVKGDRDDAEELMPARGERMADGAANITTATGYQRAFAGCIRRHSNFH